MRRTWTSLHHLIGEIDELFKPADGSIGRLHRQLICNNFCFPSENLRVNVGIGYFGELILSSFKDRLGSTERSVSGGFRCLQADNDCLVLGLARVIKFPTILQFLLIVIDLILEVINLVRKLVKQRRTLRLMLKGHLCLSTIDSFLSVSNILLRLLLGSGVIG